MKEKIAPGKKKDKFYLIQNLVQTKLGSKLGAYPKSNDRNLIKRTTSVQKVRYLTLKPHFVIQSLISNFSQEKVRYQIHIYMKRSKPLPLSYQGIFVTFVIKVGMTPLENSL